MKFGISSFAYRWAIGRPYYRPEKPMQIEQFLDHVAEFNVRHAFLCNNFEWRKLPERRLEEVRECARERDILLEVGARETEVEAFRAALRGAEILGSRVLRLVYDLNRSKDPEQDRRELDRLCRFLEEVLPDARKAGITLALENGPILTHTELAELIRRFEGAPLGACLDSMNCVYTVHRPAEVFEALAPRAVMAHLKDYTIVPNKRGYIIQGTALGAGEANIAQLVKCLEDANFSGCGYLELYIDRAEEEAATLAQEARCVEESIRYARSLGLV